MGASEKTVRRAGGRDPNVRIVARAIADPRFPALTDGEVRFVRLRRDDED